MLSEDKLKEHLERLLTYHHGIEWMAIIDSNGELLSRTNPERSLHNGLGTYVQNISSQINGMMIALGQSQSKYVAIESTQSTKVLLYPIDCVQHTLIICVSNEVQLGLLHLDVSRMVTSICNSNEAQH